MDESEMLLARIKAVAANPARKIGRCSMRSSPRPRQAYTAGTGQGEAEP
jgi:hypothetical protein